MPHFIIDCSKQILEQKTPKGIVELVFRTALSSGLFESVDSKVRINPFQYHTQGRKSDN